MSLTRASRPRNRGGFARSAADTILVGFLSRVLARHFGLRRGLKRCQHLQKYLVALRAWNFLVI